MTDRQPPAGASVALGNHRAGRSGVVVRHFENGFAMAFLTPIPEHEFGSYMSI